MPNKRLVLSRKGPDGAAPRPASLSLAPRPASAIASEVRGSTHHDDDDNAKGRASEFNPASALVPRDPAGAAMVSARDPAQASNLVLMAQGAVGASASAYDVEQQARAVAISSALVADLSARADKAARFALPSMSDGQAALVWADVLSLLDADGLSPVVFCSRSGRDLGAVDPSPWRDHLAVIHALGDSRAADGALMRLVSAIQAVKGHTVAPPLLVTSVDALALLRELHPLDYVMSALSRVVATSPDKGPMAQSLALAVRAELLGKMRRDAAALPRPVLEYLAECLTLYLAHVSPDRVPMRHNAAAFYDVERWASALVSAASVSHLCNRLVLTLWNLIQSRRLRPAHHITIDDLRALRVHWGGLAEYQNLRAARLVVRSMTSGNRTTALGADPVTGRGGVRYDAGAVAGLGDAVLGFDLADTLDLQSALRMTGRKVPIAVHSALDHERLTQRRATIERLARDLLSEDDPAMPDLALDFGLSGVAASGALSDMLSPDYADAGALFDAGAFDDGSADDLFSLLYDPAGDAIDDDETSGAVETLDDDDDNDDDDDTFAAFGLGDVARSFVRSGPAMSQAAISDIQAGALERAITAARPLAKLRPKR